MASLFILKPGLTSVVPTAGRAVLVADITMGIDGGVIINPLAAVDQGIASEEPLWVSLLGSAATAEVYGTSKLLPGQSFLVPPLANVWVNAQTAGHKFTSYFSSTYQPPYPPAIVPGQPTIPGFPGSSEAALGGEAGTGPFPPTGVTGLTGVIPSYLYQEYSDDDDLQGFVAAQNAQQQNFVDTFNALNLPYYPGPIVANKLLDWVGHGLYGMPRPALSSGIPNLMGPLNTYGCDWLVPEWGLFSGNQVGYFGLNIISVYGPEDVVITDDDVYRRVLTWHFFKGDGKYFDTRWLKRRVWRFLFGNNGVPSNYSWDPNLDGPHPPNTADADDQFIADTSQISVSLGTNRNVTIRFVLGDRTVAGGCLPNAFGCNGFGINRGQELGPEFIDVQLNDLETNYVTYPPLPFMSVFKEALDSGVLEVPYQYNFTCNIG